jgi:hypothetical protein
VVSAFAFDWSAGGLLGLERRHGGAVVVHGGHAVYCCQRARWVGTILPAAVKAVSRYNRFAGGDGSLLVQ